MYIQTKLFRLFSLYSVLVTSVLLMGCGQTGSSTKSFKYSDYYTLGIGQYPGLPSEDFSPLLRPDVNTYRNIALLRSAYHSSSYDYNLTAQLTTDGIVTTRQPHRIMLSTPNGKISRRESEWMLDKGPYSHNTVNGEDTYFEISLVGWRETADKLQFRGSVAYDKGRVKRGYEMICEGSVDGQIWTELGAFCGNGMPGDASKYMAHSDPNKNSWESGTLPTRSINLKMSLEKKGNFSYYRLHLKMEGAVYWTFFEMNFFNDGKMIDLLPSKFFDSTWMSQGIQKEWVYVDLGSKSTFDKVKLSWVNKAIKGKLQVSDNASQWTDLAELPAGNRLVDEIDVKGEGRYVRVLMNESANGKPYALSEIEVMGKGGLVAHPKAQPIPEGNKLILSGGNWHIQRASQVTAQGEEISQPNYSTKHWVVATVPGTVLTSYKNVGAIPNPNYADNIFLLSESFFNSNFWYRNEFELPRRFKKERLFLNFDGINWKANIFLNGQKLGRMEGAFIRGQYDVTDLIVPGKNVVAVEIIKNAHIGAIKEKYEKNTDFNGGILGADNPTFHASIGWDWISTIRGRNIGIWNDVSLTTSGKVTLQDPFVQSILPLPDTTSVALTPEVIVKNHDNKSVNGVLCGSIGNITFKQSVTLKAGEEKAVRFTPDRFAQLNLKNPKLWWPKGYGSPYLYKANFTFKIDGQISDTEDFNIGIRQMTFNEDHSILSIFINGRRFIGRGGNWGFSENNLNYRGREYDIAMAYHADMNFTMIRNWVGQIGDEEFYEAADRYGLMIWQDFWLANPADGPDPYNPTMFIANAEDYVRRIRKHASVGIYCGRNEGFPPEVIDKALRRIVKDKHPGLHYISSSADDVVSGHGPYRALPVKEYFSIQNGSDKFHSERGMPNVMTYESFKRTFAPEAIWPQNVQWGQHDYTMEGAQSCATFNEMITRGFGKPKNAKEFADLAQWISYDGYRGLFESRSLNRKGLLLWMTHPAWPSMVWQTYDYYFEPTAAYFGCKKASEPLHIQWNPMTNKVEIVNYSVGNQTSLQAKAQILNMDGSVMWEKKVNVNSYEDSTTPCIDLQFPKEISVVHYVKLTLSGAYGLISDNFYLHSIDEGNYQALRKLPRISLKTDIQTIKNEGETWNGSVIIKNNTETPALMIRINVLGATDGEQILPMFYSDNYFSLLPGEKKTVKLHWNDRDTRGQKPRIVVSGYNVN